MSPPALAPFPASAADSPIDVVVIPDRRPIQAPAVQMQPHFEQLEEPETVDDMFGMGASQAERPSMVPTSPVRAAAAAPTWIQSALLRARTPGQAPPCVHRPRGIDAEKLMQYQKEPELVIPEESDSDLAVLIRSKLHN